MEVTVASPPIRRVAVGLASRAPYLEKSDWSKVHDSVAGGEIQGMEEARDDEETTIVGVKLSLVELVMVQVHTNNNNASKEIASQLLLLVVVGM
ncbi:uncharacterized protein ARMOST_13601 [Armillaria ostoyae]|uniref:Uncharacterized protein n=1 Tax=Armillaria ostoyae TaxID=47428 RepID=A0A284RN79_ARMOS|nr:uncharacterized protein ARMOST_13601 [Armillaria ostoyae]